MLFCSVIKQSVQKARILVLFPDITFSKKEELFLYNNIGKNMPQHIYNLTVY